MKIFILWWSPFFLHLHIIHFQMIGLTSSSRIQSKWVNMHTIHNINAHEQLLCRFTMIAMFKISLGLFIES